MADRMRVNSDIALMVVNQNHAATANTGLSASAFASAFALSVLYAIVCRVAAPHLPAVVFRIAGFQAKEAAGVRRHIDAALDHGRLEENRRADVDFPVHLAFVGGQANDISGSCADESFAVDQCRRSRQAVDLVLV